MVCFQEQMAALGRLAWDRVWYSGGHWQACGHRGKEQAGPGAS